MTLSGRLILVVSCLAFLASCGNPAITVSFEAEPALKPRLESILASVPLPANCTRVEDSNKAGFRVVLKTSAKGTTFPAGDALCGTVYYAAAADLASREYSVSAERAEELGMEALETIVPPRRALAVNGLWPSSPRYPFARRLVLSAEGSAAGSSRSAAVPAKLLGWIAAAAKIAVAADKAPLLLTAAGDIQVGEAQGPILLGGEAGLRELLHGDIIDRLRRADLAFANLENPLSSRGEPNPRKRYRFRMPPGASAALKEAGFGLMLFGNNHAFDFGPEAFEDSLADLEKAALPMVGAGRNLGEAAAARFMELPRGEKLAFVGYAFFPNESRGFTRAEAAAGVSSPGISADEEAAMRTVREAAATGACVIVLAHGGTEYVERPSDGARKLYARFIDAGASLIVGTHPHLLQGCEARSGAIIAYSLGNFLFTEEAEPPEAWKGAMLDFLMYRGKVRGIFPRPIIAGYHYTEVDSDQDAAEARFSKLCADIAALPPI
jgi:poly-gamma-glutamate synthesis protein (capsule biosynthesis protein)